MLGLQYSRFFSDFFNGKIEPQHFESWLFQHPELSLKLGENLYLDLMALSFSKPGIRYEIKDLVNQYINFEAVQKAEIAELLKAGIDHSIVPLELLERLYDYAMQGALGDEIYDLVGNFNEVGKSPLTYLVGLDAPKQWAKLDLVAPDFGNWMEKVLAKIG